MASVPVGTKVGTYDELETLLDKEDTQIFVGNVSCTYIFNYLYKYMIQSNKISFACIIKMSQMIE